MKTRIHILLVIFLMSVLCIVGLISLSPFARKFSNSFIRKLPPHKVNEQNVKNIGSKNIYIAGHKGDTIYIGDFYKKDKLQCLTSNSLDTLSLMITAPDDFKTFGDANVQISDSALYFMDGMKASISIGNASDFALTKYIATPSFSACIPLSKTSFLFRCVNKNNENVLAKKIIGDSSLMVNDRILTKQVDGFFCTDGIFVKAPNTDKVIYVYYYRNQFIAADTNLNLIYKANTIDTVTQAKIKIGKIHSENKITMSAPPFYVNKHATCNEQYLFVHSVLKADNDTDEIHEKAAAIDVYLISDGKYQFSFYLPDFGGHKLADFKVYDKELVAIFDSYVCSFKLNF